MTEPIALGLDAVIVAVTDDQPRILTVATGGDGGAIPSGPLDVTFDETLELGLRRWVKNQTGIDLGYAEQLYTFGDRDRSRAESGERVLSVAYLALVREAQPSPGAAWLDLYRMFPWEDHRTEPGPPLVEDLREALDVWAGHDDRRRARTEITFGGGEVPWDPIRVLERYELLYEASLIPEWFTDRSLDVPPLAAAGIPLAFDHRRIAATALGRLRGKLTYRPVIFELLGTNFTLTQLQHAVEALIGQRLHTQNFRRLVDREHLVEGTGEQAASTGGRPAELFRFRNEVVNERPRPGVRLPGLGG